jgi:hypothetical protein
MRSRNRGFPSACTLSSRHYWEIEEKRSIVNKKESRGRRGKRVRLYFRCLCWFRRGLQISSKAVWRFESTHAFRRKGSCDRSLPSCRHAIFRTSELGGQFILLGSAPDPRIQGEFQQLADQFRESKSVRLLLTYRYERGLGFEVWSLVCCWFFSCLEGPAFEASFERH